MALSRMLRIRDSSSENVFGIYNGDVFVQPLSNFTIQYIFEVESCSRIWFTLFNGDDLG